VGTTSKTNSGRQAPAAAIVFGWPDDIARATSAAKHWGALRVAGFVTPASEPCAAIEGAPWLGPTLADAVERSDVPLSSVVLCGAAPELARDVLHQANDLGLRVLIAAHDERRPRVLRIADLLGGAAARSDWSKARAAIAGKRVLVTGAGGSIGAELCRRIAALGPERLTLLENSEFNLYKIDHELAARAPEVSRGRALCDVRDAEALQRWFRRERPNVVLHVAALKHVPMVEEFASEGVLTNVLGTRNVVEAARASGAHMMLVSTDKAASPASAMGATKRIAELVAQTHDRQAVAEDAPRFVTARLGNVLGSAGSVSPVFARQIASGGPVTVTHPDVARYFITIQQAAHFLLQALAEGLAPASPRGAALVLDMGEPVRVVDLASDMIRLKGLRPDADIPIQFVGLRPGEKMTEQLIDEHETVVSAPGAPIIAVQSEARDLATLNADIDRLVMMARAGHDDLVRERLLQIASARRQVARAV
jgi:O-antigen biosynthesis protein WbqV